jgi:hypothetical protein
LEFGGNDETIKRKHTKDSSLNSDGHSKAKLVAGIVVCLLIIGRATNFAFWVRSAESILFATLVTVLLPISFLLSWKLGEKEMARRLDKAMDTKDDPNEMARWVP